MVVILKRPVHGCQLPQPNQWFQYFPMPLWGLTMRLDERNADERLAAEAFGHELPVAMHFKSLFQRHRHRRLNL